MKVKNTFQTVNTKSFLLSPSNAQIMKELL